MNQEVKRITLGLVLSWIFGIFFGLSGISSISEKYFISGFSLIIIALLLFPFTKKILRRTLNIELSSGLKFVLIALLLVIFFTNKPLVNKRIEKTEYSTDSEDKTVESDTIKHNQIPKERIDGKKVRSATLSIDRVQIVWANLYPTRITVLNTGNVTIHPKFDIYVFDSNGKEVCNGSPLSETFYTIVAGEKQTDEIQILGCVLPQDGGYSLKIDLLDDDFTMLDSKTKKFTLNDYEKLKFKIK